MGFFSRLEGHVKDLNNMAIAVGNVIALLDRYDETNDGYALLIAAWLCKRGIQDVVAAGNLSPVHTINVFVNQRLEKMTVQDAYIKSIGRLSMIAKEMSDQDSEDILDIINGGDAFDKVDSSLSEDKKQRLLKQNLTF